MSKYTVSKRVREGLEEVLEEVLGEDVNINIKMMLDGAVVMAGVDKIFIISGKGINRGRIQNRYNIERALFASDDLSEFIAKTFKDLLL